MTNEKSHDAQPPTNVGDENINPSIEKETDKPIKCESTAAIAPWIAYCGLELP